MLEADALLVFQADNCNNQIPAKVYEYLFAGKPILGITDPQGDTGRLLLEAGVATVAEHEDEAAISRLLSDGIARLRNGGFLLADRARVLGLSRRARTSELAAALDEIMPANPSAAAISAAARTR